MKLKMFDVLLYCRLMKYFFHTIIYFFNLFNRLNIKR
jgi:hypothetical protein